MEKNKKSAAPSFPEIKNLLNQINFAFLPYGKQKEIIRKRAEQKNKKG